ncbi:MAG: hypothetical protein QMC97_06265, partial [Pseudothermotoga sp.]|uniref:hypothetical protein n=1 Tax=Pseudothermotoga sp. TaxID=2033661 RepID=UPI0025857E14
NGYYDALGSVVRMFESMRKDLESFIQMAEPEDRERYEEALLDLSVKMQNAFTDAYAIALEVMDIFLKVNKGGDRGSCLVEELPSAQGTQQELSEN